MKNCENQAKLENLVEDLRCCAMPYTCPHGRPTLIEMNYRKLEKKFGRIQKMAPQKKTTN